MSRRRVRDEPSVVGRVASWLGVWAFKAFMVVLWSVGSYPLLVLTLVAGGCVVVGLTAVSAQIYESVTEAEGVAALDQPALHAAVAVRTPWLTSAVAAFTFLGSDVGMTTIASVSAAALAMKHNRWSPMVLVGAAAAGSVLMTIVGKQVVGRVRPPVEYAVPPYETSGSFPSGHTLNAVVVIGLIAYLVVLSQRRWGVRAATIAVATGFCLAMGLSRVYLGHHWLTDVLVAWTLGLAWLSIVIAAHQLYRTVRDRRRNSSPEEGGHEPPMAARGE